MPGYFYHTTSSLPSLFILGRLLVFVIFENSYVRYVKNRLDMIFNNRVY